MNYELADMLFEGKIKRRNCPICENENSTLLVSLKYENIIPLNHTFRADWFNEDGVPAGMAFPIVKCNDCRFVFSNYALGTRLQHSFYHEGIDAEASKKKIFARSKRENLLKIWTDLLFLCEIEDRPLKVLDFGSGWGDFLAIAKCHGVEVFGLEFDSRKIEFANRHHVPSGDMDFIRKNAPFDIFMCHQVLEHLENPVKALSELKGLLVSGAKGYVSVPNFSSERLNAEISLIQKGNPPSKDLDPFGHLNYFNPESFSKILFNAGFEEINGTPQPATWKSIFHISDNKKKEPRKLTSAYLRNV